MARLAVLLALLAGLAATAVACGGGDDGGGDRLSKPEYQQQVEEIGSTVSAAFEGVQAQSSPDQVRTQLEETSDALRAAADDFDELTPPEEVEQPHALLVEGVRELADDFEELLGTLEGVDDPSQVAQSFGDFANRESLQKLQQAQQQFEELGYSFGDSG